MDFIQWVLLVYSVMKIQLRLLTIATRGQTSPPIQSESVLTLSIIGSLAFDRTYPILRYSKLFSLEGCTLIYLFFGFLCNNCISRINSRRLTFFSCIALPHKQTALSLHLICLQFGSYRTLVLDMQEGVLLGVSNLVL